MATLKATKLCYAVIHHEVLAIPEDVFWVQTVSSNIDTCQDRLADNHVTLH